MAAFAGDYPVLNDRPDWAILHTSPYAKGKFTKENVRKPELHSSLLCVNASRMILQH